MLIWLFIRVAGPNSGLFKQGFQCQANFLEIRIQERLTGNQDALETWWHISDDFLQSSPQQPFGSISLDCVAY
jgi:hypothetical protein